jgi:hypothetical protein
VTLNYSGETHRLLAIEATEFMLDCLNNDMKLKDIQEMYIKKTLTTLTYGSVLQQLIREHVDCHNRLANERKVQTA